MNHSLARLLKIVLLVATLGLVLPASGALGEKTEKRPSATGTGGAVASASRSSPTEPCRERARGESGAMTSSDY